MRPPQRRKTLWRPLGEMNKKMAVPLVTLWDPIEESEEISAVPPADGVTEAMPVNNGTASAVSPEADGNY
jgi:hypothetical protein